jgi:hypothetical protein
MLESTEGEIRDFEICISLLFRQFNAEDDRVKYLRKQSAALVPPTNVSLHQRGSGGGEFFQLARADFGICWRRVLYLADFPFQGDRCLTGFGDVCVTGSSYRRL